MWFLKPATGMRLTSLQVLAFLPGCEVVAVAGDAVGDDDGLNSFHYFNVLDGGAAACDDRGVSTYG